MCLFSVMKKLWKSAKCAVAKYRYYGVKGDDAWAFDSTSDPKMLNWWQPKLIEESDYVWCQGPKGGVRLVYQNWDRAYETDFACFKKQGYITNDPEAMKEFAWVKLRARTLTIGK